MEKMELIIEELRDRVSRGDTEIFLNLNGVVYKFYGSGINFIKLYHSDITILSAKKVKGLFGTEWYEGEILHTSSKLHSDKVFLFIKLDSDLLLSVDEFEYSDGVFIASLFKH